jgi:hypothetical protein
MIKQNLLLAAIACACFMISSALQTEDAVLKDAEGEWVFESAEIQERMLNSNDTYTKKTLVATDEIVADTHSFQMPLWIRFDHPGERTATLRLNNSMSSFDKLHCEWIKDGKNFRLNLLQSPNAQKTQENIKAGKIMVSYYGVKMSLGKELSMKYNYVYNTADNNYVEAIFTVYLKKKQA